MATGGRKIGRRDALKVMGAVMGVGALDACAGAIGLTPTPGSVATTAAATAVPAASATPLPLGASVIPLAAKGGLSGNLTMGIMAGPEQEANARLASMFAAATRGTLKMQVQPVAVDLWTSEMVTMFQSKSSAWDVVSVGSNRLKLCVDGGWLTPVSDFFGNSDLFDATIFDVNDWPKAIRDLMTYNGKLYEFPQGADADMMFYRKDFVEKYGLQTPPLEGWSWSQLIDNARQGAKAIKADNLEGKMYPLIFPLSSEQLFIVYLQNAWSYGAPVYLEGETVPNFNCEQSVQAVADLKSWFDEGLMSKGCLGYGFAEINAAMQQNAGIYMLQWSSGAPELEDATTSPTTAGKLGYCNWPYEAAMGPAVLRCWPSMFANGVSAFSKQQEAAFSYCAWFSSKEVARTYCLAGGGDSGRSSLLTDPQVLKANPQYEGMLAGLATYHPQEAFASVDYVERNILGPYLNSVLTGSLKPQEAMDKATQESVAYLKQKGEIS
ncbi:MAG: extracellular solute-binding protein [Anaerolineales bacterium]|jgi:ABC-type glycerol-3-phosphate transport system substrate-binding protein